MSILDARRTLDAAAATGECVSLPPNPSCARLSVCMEGCAMIQAASYDAEILRVLTWALEEAWKDVQSALGVKPLEPELLKTRLKAHHGCGG